MFLRLNSIPFPKSQLIFIPTFSLPFMTQSSLCPGCDRTLQFPSILASTALSGDLLQQPHDRAPACLLTHYPNSGSSQLSDYLPKRDVVALLLRAFYWPMWPTNAGTGGWLADFCHSPEETWTIPFAVTLTLQSHDHVLLLPLTCWSIHPEVPSLLLSGLEPHSTRFTCYNLWEGSLKLQASA